MRFIGPSPESIKLMGDKAKARETAEKAGVPVLPGSKGVTEESSAIEIARELGFPVIVKAAAGGGGKGMRVVMEETEFCQCVRDGASRSACGL